MTVGQSRNFAARHPWARYAVSAVLLAAAVALLPGQRLAGAFHNLDARLLAAALPAYLVIHCLAALKWHVAVSRSGAGLPWRRTIECYFAGIFGTLFLPSLAGGDAVAVALAGRHAARPAGVIAGAVLSRGLDVIALGLLVGLAAVSVPGALAGEGAHLLHTLAVAAAAALSVAAGATLLLRPALCPAWLERRLAPHAAAFEPLRRPSLAVLPLGMSLVVQVGFAVVALGIARACGLRIGFGPWMFAWLLAKLVAFLPLTIAGIGARELALAALLAPFGIAAGPAVTVGLVWDMVAVSGCLASGALWKLLGYALSPSSSRSRIETQ